MNRVLPLLFFRSKSEEMQHVKFYSDSTVVLSVKFKIFDIFQLLEELGKGHAVSLVPTESEITTQQAADLLNVSRPFLIGMIDKGELPARMVGNQRRLPLTDVLAYKAANRAKRLEALAEMTKLDQELGLR